MTLNRSIFNLIENPKELPSSNENMAEMFYREILPVRDVTDKATSSNYSSKFGGSNISIRWSFDNGTWWLPSRSYLKFDIVLQRPGDEQTAESLVTSDLIAPNMGMAASLLNRMHFKMNDITVCQISQYIPQVEAMAQRLYHSSEWMGKNIGNDTNFWNAYHKIRLQEMTSDGFKPHEQQPFIDYTKSNNDKTLSSWNIITSTQLGLDTSTVQVFNDTTCEFISTNNIPIDLTKLEINRFDIIVFKLSDTLYSFFMISEILSSTTLYLASFNNQYGLFAGFGPLATDFILLKWRDRIDSKAMTSELSPYTAQWAATREISGGTNLITFANGITDQHTEPGDIILNLPNGAGGQLMALFIPTPPVQTALVVPFASTIYSVAQLAETIGNKTSILKTSYLWEALNREELGFDAYGQNNNTFLIAGPAGNNILFVSANGGGAVGTAANSFFNIFQFGDIITYTTQANTNILMYMIIEVLSPTTARIAGSGGNIPNLGVGNDGRDTIGYRYRYKAVNPKFECINLAKNKQSIDLVWKPSCLSIFNYPGAIPGGCKFEIELQALAQKYVGLAVETPFGINKIGRTTNGSTSSDYQLLIKNVKYYVCHVKGPIVGASNYSYYINLNEIRAHTRRITSSALIQTTVDVMPSSYALSLAFQDVRADDSSQTQLSCTKFHVGNFEELSLTRYSIRFAGLSLPQPDAEISNTDSEEKLYTHYMRNQIYTNQYYKSSAGENFQEWKERGIYFYHPFIRSAGNRETRAYVITEFNNEQLSTESQESNLRMFLFEFYRAFALIKMSNGSVYDIKTANQ